MALLLERAAGKTARGIVARAVPRDNQQKDVSEPMDNQTRATFDNLLSPDGPVRNTALNASLQATDQPVDWAYEVWDELLERLRHKDGHQRAIASTLLCNLAKSDPQNRMLTDFDTILAVTRDAKFVTARHTLQALWKVGAAGPKQRQLVVDRLAGRFKDCAAEKNCTLIRFDIIQGLRHLYDAVKDENIKAVALALIETEPDLKYRKKYAGVWRSA
jgi:hypothetical protein